MNAAGQRWALAAGSAIVTAVLAGLGWWLLAGRHAAAPGAGFSPAPTLGVVLAPNTEWRQLTDEFDVQVRTNSLGLRGPEPVVPKPADRYRVLILGDSFTFGWGIELQDVWHLKLARELQASDGRSVEVIAAGVPGWCPLQQFVFLEQRGLELQPDLVLWQLCTNDLLDMGWLSVELDARRLPVAVAAGTQLTTRMREEWLPQLERLDKDVRERVEAEYLAGRIDPVLRKIARTADTARREQAGAAPEGEIAELPIAEVQRGLRTGSDFDVRYLDHIVSSARSLCLARDVPLRLMLAHLRPALPGAEPDEDVLALRAWGSRQSPQMLDTAEALSAGRTEDFYFARDRHWTPAAQPRVAEAVARWLAEDQALRLKLQVGR